MRVFMLGWEFPPFISGGLGTACYGLTKAMSKQGTEVIFALPKSVDRKFSTHVKMLSPKDCQRSGDVEFEYTICGRPNCDVDNYAKAILDSIQRAKIIKNDSQVQKLVGQKCQKCRNKKRGERCLYSFWCELRL